MNLYKIVIFTDRCSMKIKETAQLIYNQLQHVLQQLDNSQYVQEIDLLETTIGKHTRHIVNFYEAIALKSECVALNYDNRQREVLLETNIDFLLNRFEETIAAFDCLEEDETILLISNFDTTNNDDYALKTSMGRELLYAFEHAVHHMAIIKIGLKHAFSEVEIAPDFGIAPSTIKYRKACVQ